MERVRGVMFDAGGVLTRPVLAQLRSRDHGVTLTRDAPPGHGGRVIASLDDLLPIVDRP